MNIPILDEIMAALDRIDDADLNRALWNLSPPEENEVKIGEIHSNETRCMWALAEKYKGKYLDLTTRSEYAASSPDEKKFMLIEAARFDTLASLCRDIFWAQVRDELGSTAHQETARIGIRTNYVIVRSPAPDNPLVQMFKQRIEGPDA